MRFFALKGSAAGKTLRRGRQLESLEDLENALHFGNLSVEGLGPRRKQMIAAVLAERL